MPLVIEAVELNPASGGRAEFEVRLANGKAFILFAAMPGAPGDWVSAGGGSYSGAPMVYVRALDAASVRAAADALAADLSGYWLSYTSRASRERPSEEPLKPLKVALVELADREPADGRKDHGAAVVHATITDGREFSMLAATPSWFAEAFETGGLRHYWGPSILFLSKLEKALAKKAVEAMLKRGDRWLCLYDTPRTTLPKVLADFKARSGKPGSFG